MPPINHNFSGVRQHNEKQLTSGKKNGIIR